MLLKYDPLAIPRKNEHDGFVFQSSDKFNIATVAKRNDRARYVRQHQRQLPLMASNQHWRNLPANVKTNWSIFATAFPEPTKANPNVFLTGYQLFCKRQQYVFLNGGLAEPWLSNPIPPKLDTITFNASIKQENHCIDVTELYIMNFGLLPKKGQFLFLKILPYQTKGGKFYPVYEQTAIVDDVYLDGLFLSISFPKTTMDITFSVFLSPPQSQNAIYQSSKVRYMGCFTVKSFLDLSDTPDSYESEHGKMVIVNDDETGLIFAPVPFCESPFWGGSAHNSSDSSVNLPVPFIRPSAEAMFLGLSMVIEDRTNDQRMFKEFRIISDATGLHFLALSSVGVVDSLSSIYFVTDIFSESSTPLRVLFNSVIEFNIAYCFITYPVATWHY